MQNQRLSRKHDKIRYAVVGLGHLSQFSVLPAFAYAAENSELAALVSDDARKLQKLSRKFQIARTYTYEQYADCLESGEIDAVYIALPNHMHGAFAEAAAHAGIHVLCEKPMAFDETECHAIIAAAETAGVKLMIAYPLHFERENLHVLDVIQSGKIGEPRIFTSTFSQQLTAGNSHLKREIGGTIYDMGVYCIKAARRLFCAEPTEVFAWNASSINKRFDETPEITTGILKFPGDRMASFTASFGAANRSTLEIIGTKGVFRMDPAYEMAEDLKSEIAIEGWKVKEVFKKRDPFAPELVYFSNCILNDHEPEPSGRDGLADVRVIRALMRSAEINRPVLLSAVDIDRQPETFKELSKEPVVKPPQLARAAASAAD